MVPALPRFLLAKWLVFIFGLRKISMTSLEDVYLESHLSSSTVVWGLQPRPSLILFSALRSPEAHSHQVLRGLFIHRDTPRALCLEQTFKQDEGRYEMSYEECEVKTLQSIPSSGKHAHMEPGGPNCSLGSTAGSQLFIWACITRW